jgi:serine/threonine protein kinase
VHGDLKPANVLLMADGSVRLADFNLAAEMDGTHAYSPAFATTTTAMPARRRTAVALAATALALSFGLEAGGTAAAASASVSASGDVAAAAKPKFHRTNGIPTEKHRKPVHFNGKSYTGKGKTWKDVVSKNC